ncbi:MAG: hypothetical protein ACLROG_03875 [Coprococcus phoceensis]
MLLCFKIYDHEFFIGLISKGLIDISNLSIAGDGMPVINICTRTEASVFANVPKMELLPVTVTVTFPSLTVTSVMILPENAFTMATTYILVALNSESDLPLFPLFNPASKHDSHGFLEAYFRFKLFLPDFHVRKWLLDSAHDADVLLLILSARMIFSLSLI